MATVRAFFDVFSPSLDHSRLCAFEATAYKGAALPPDSYPPTVAHLFRPHINEHSSSSLSWIAIEALPTLYGSQLAFVVVSWMNNVASVEKSPQVSREIAQCRARTLLDCMGQVSREPRIFGVVEECHVRDLPICSIWRLAAWKLDEMYGSELRHALDAIPDTTMQLFITACATSAVLPKINHSTADPEVLPGIPLVLQAAELIISNPALSVSQGIKCLRLGCKLCAYATWEAIDASNCASGPVEYITGLAAHSSIVQNGEQYSTAHDGDSKRAGNVENPQRVEFDLIEKHKQPKEQTSASNATVEYSKAHRLARLRCLEDDLFATESSLEHLELQQAGHLSKSQ